MALLETVLIEGNDYTFKQLRQVLTLFAPQEGVFGANDYKVTAGAGMTVSVASGDAVVDMDSGSFNGRYFQKNDAAVVVTVGAAHATLPRIDQIILTINDSTVSGASDTPTLSCLAGTATSGATLDNRLGAAGLPRNSIRFADVLVPAASASVSAGNIRDRRPWARGAYWRTFIIGGNKSTASTTYASLDATNLNPRIESSGVPMTVALMGTWNDSSGTGTGPAMRLAGTDVYSIMDLVDAGTFGGKASLNVRWELQPTVGSKLLTPQWASATGGTVLLYASGNPNEGGIQMVVQEHPRPNTNNT